MEERKGGESLQFDVSYVLACLHSRCGKPVRRKDLSPEIPWPDKTFSMPYILYILGSGFQKTFLC